MTAAETTLRAALVDLQGILRRGGMVLGRFEALEDRIHQAQRDLEAATPKPIVCPCGEPGCQRLPVSP